MSKLLAVRLESVGSRRVTAYLNCDESCNDPTTAISHSQHNTQYMPLFSLVYLPLPHHDVDNGTLAGASYSPAWQAFTPRELIGANRKHDGTDCNLTSNCT